MKCLNVFLKFIRNAVTWADSRAHIDTALCFECKVQIKCPNGKTVRSFKRSEL